MAQEDSRLEVRDERKLTLKEKVMRFRPNKELYQHTEGMVDLMKKRRLKFYRHLL